MKKALIIFYLGVFLIGLTSAMTINYFYSDSCPHCQSIKPFMQKMINKYPDKNFRLYNVERGTYNITAIPTVEIKTSDCRTITLVGTDQIVKNLECELQEMSTPECITYSAEIKRGKTDSWFIR